MKTFLIIMMMVVSFSALSAETVLECRITQISNVQAFGRSVSLQGSASEVILEVHNEILAAKLGNYAFYSAGVSREIVTYYDLSDKELVYLSKPNTQEMIVLSVAKKRNSSGLRLGQVILKRDLKESIVAHLNCL